ncbi:MAG: hypothetical protein ACYC2Y_08915 [Armatimonadota bacterium]
MVDSGDRTVAASNGGFGLWGIGSVIAGLISWDATKSLGWTILHVIGSWIYVLYSWYIGRIHW